MVTDDKNRVVLVRPSGDLDTDYINASFIQVRLSVMLPGCICIQVRFL